MNFVYKVFGFDVTIKWLMLLCKAAHLKLFLFLENDISSDLYWQTLISVISVKVRGTMKIKIFKVAQRRNYRH